MPRLKGVIFDLDGTLVDSKLDFDLMRVELGIPGKKPVLEWVEAMPNGERKEACREVLLKHELRGAREAVLIPGIAELLLKLGGLGLHRGILTRNRREPTSLTLERLGLNGFSQVVTRENARAKPHPEGLYRICRAWGCAPEEVLYLGDFRFDLMTGRNAGVKTVLYVAGEDPSFIHEAEHVTRDFLDFAEKFEELLAEMGFSAE